MANQSNNNLFGKMGKNELDNLQKAIDLLIKYNNMQKQVTSTSSKDTQRVIDLRLRYAEQLKKLNVDLNTDVKELQARYKETERQLKAQSEEEDRINKQRLKQQREINKERKRSKLISQLERDFQLEISGKSKKEIEQQKALNKIKDEALKKAENLRLSEDKRKKIISEAAEQYNKVNKQYDDLLRDEETKKTNKTTVRNAVAGMFGISESNIKDAKNGTLGWKVITDTFSKAVNIFSRAVKEGFDKNFNSTEKTLNSITASNSMSWSSGNFNFGGRSYSGYSKVNNAIVDQLKSEGLYNNISNTEVMEAAAELTSSGGMNISDAVRKGYQDTVIKYIVPYLDTATEAFESTERLIPRNF